MYTIFQIRLQRYYKIIKYARNIAIFYENRMKFYLFVHYITNQAAPKSSLIAISYK